MSTIRIKIKKENLPKQRNEELHNALVSCRHQVIPDKKKQARKNACRIRAYDL